MVPTAESGAACCNATGDACAALSLPSSLAALASAPADAGTPEGRPAATPGGAPCGTPGGGPIVTPGGGPCRTPGGGPIVTPGGGPMVTNAGGPCPTPGGGPAAKAPCDAVQIAPVTVIKRRLRVMNTAPLGWVTSGINSGLLSLPLQSLSSNGSASTVQA